MLVLTRKIGEEIFIGEDLVIRVTDVRGSRVTLGIEAEPNIKVRRGELPTKEKAVEFALAGARG